MPLKPTSRRIAASDVGCHRWRSRARLSAAQDDGEIATATEFFERYGYFIPEYRRGDPMEVVRQILVQMLGMIETGAIRLSIGAAELS